MARSRRLYDVDLNITSRCNLRCDFCSVFVLPVSHPAAELTLDDIGKLFHEFDALGVEVVRLVGGEPFVRRDIADILRLSTRFRFGISILTNGTLMRPEHVRLVRECGVELVAFSIDGPTPEVHDRSRGQARSFERAVAAIERCAAAGVRRRMMTAITAATLPHLRELVLFADRHGFELLNFIVLGLSGSSIANRQNFPTYEEWSDAIVDLSLFLRRGRRKHVPVALLFPHEDAVPVELYDPLERAGHLELLEEIWGIDYQSFDRGRQTGKSLCTAGHNSVSIMPNGDVYGCDLMRDIPEFCAGNIHHSSLGEIFRRSPVFRRFRDSPTVRSCGSFDADATDFSCGQCRAGKYRLQLLAGD